MAKSRSETRRSYKQQERPNKSQEEEVVRDLDWDIGGWIQTFAQERHCVWSKRKKPLPHTQKKKERDRLFSLWLSQLLSPRRRFFPKVYEKKKKRPVLQSHRITDKDWKSKVERPKETMPPSQCSPPRLFFRFCPADKPHTLRVDTLGYVCWFFSARGAALHQSHKLSSNLWKALDISIHYLGLPHTRLLCCLQYHDP